QSRRSCCWRSAGCISRPIRPPDAVRRARRRRQPDRGNARGNLDMTNPVDHILELFAVGGRAAYFGEPVSQAEHALQAAHPAPSPGAAEDLVVAALLHDVGHLLHGLPETVAGEAIDARHQDGGAAWLARWFGPALTEPIRLHVAAKRYLCAVDPHYLSRL